MRTLTELGVIVIENEEGFELDMSSVKDDFNETLYEVRENRNDIDETLNFDTITNI